MSEFDLWDEPQISNEDLPEEEQIRTCPRCGGDQWPYVIGMGQPGDIHKRIRVTGCIVNFPVPIGWCEKCEYIQHPDGSFQHDPRNYEDEEI